MLPDERSAEPSNVAPTAVLVVGMHRSGTSALAGTLSMAGIELGSRLVPPAADNPKGFFEHDAVWRIHHDLLVEIGSSWHDIRPLLGDWPDGQPAKKAVARLRVELERSFSKSQLWGVKDPRLSRCFAIWPKLLVGLGVQPKVILALRDPIEVAASLQKRDGLGLAHALALWLRYTLDAEQATRSLPRVVMEYTNLLKDWRKELDRLRTELALPLPVNRNDSAIDSFLDQTLRHHTADSTTVALPQPYADWCTKTVWAMRALDENPRQAAADLDAILRAFDFHLDNALAEQSTALLKQVDNQIHTIRFLETEREKFILDQDKMRQRLELLSVERQTLDLERARINFDAKRLERELLQADSDRASFDHDQKEKRLEFVKLNEQHDSLKRLIEQERARWSCSQSELVEVRNALQNAKWQLDHIRGELDQVYRSRSWRITRPLRYVLRQTRQIRNLARDLRGLLRIAGQPIMATATSPVVQMQPPPTELDYGVTSHAGDQVTRLLIITPDLHGPIRNGGIGTAFSALAEAAVRDGFNVTILYTLGQHSEDGPISRWVEHYAAHGVRLIPLDDAKGDTPTIDAPWYRIGAWRVHTWLQQHQQQFDIVVFPEWMGLAYYVLLAKGQGLAYEGLPIVVNTHSPESWAAEGNRRMPDWPDDIDRDFMERESVRRADLVVSPSAYMLDWMREHRWQLPSQSLVIPNLTPKSLRMATAMRCFSSQHIDRIVFFGRLEPRKGLKLFCDAIDRLPVNVRKHIGRVTFLGKSIATPGGFDSRQFIAQRSAQWGVSVEVLTDRNRDGALAELEQPGTLAVIPSLVENSPYTVLECLMRGIIFLASRVGGIPELLAASDHASHLFDPNPRALAQALEGAIMHGIQPAALAWDTEEVEQSWLTLLRSFSEKEKRNQPALTISSEMPRVSVCLVHYNRPHLLAQALDSLRAQTYTNFEVVLVDDGSPSDEAKTYLEAIEHEFATRQWQIIRQENSYLGAARNTAASAAKGDYLLFMDDDNVATPEMISTFVQAAVASGADVLTCPTMPFTGNRPPHKLERIWLPLGGAVGAGLYRNAFGDANALWKRSSFKQVGGYTTDYGVGHEDWELFADAVLSGLRLELVAKPLYWYRVNKQGMLRTGDHWADHARSLRPYLRHDPQGLGMALAYGLLLQRLREIGTQPVVHRAARWRALLRAARLAGDPSLRAQFLGSMRSQGLRVAIRRALAKAGR